MTIQTWFKSTWAKTQEQWSSARNLTWTKLDVTKKRVTGWWSTFGVALRKYVSGPTLEEINALSKRVEELAKKVEKVTAGSAAKISAPRVARRR